MLKNILKFESQVAPKLTDGQQAMHNLLSRAFIEKRVVKKAELFDCYREVAKGHHNIEKYTDGAWITRLEPWDTYFWNKNFEAWFVRTLGALVKKGSLRVVPSIDFTTDTQIIESSGGIEKYV